MMFGPRARTSPSGAILTSTPGIVFPTVPNFGRSSGLIVCTGDGSVSPHTWISTHPLGPREDLPLECAAGERVLEHAGVYLLVQPRHRHYHGRPHLLQVLRDGV